VGFHTWWACQPGRTTAKETRTKLVFFVLLKPRGQTWPPKPIQADGAHLVAPSALKVSLVYFTSSSGTMSLRTHCTLTHILKAYYVFVRQGKRGPSPLTCSRTHPSVRPPVEGIWIAPCHLFRAGGPAKLSRRVPASLITVNGLYVVQSEIGWPPSGGVAVAIQVANLQAPEAGLPAPGGRAGGEVWADGGWGAISKGDCPTLQEAPAPGPLSDIRSRTVRLDSIIGTSSMSRQVSVAARSIGPTGYARQPD